MRIATCTPVDFESNDHFFGRDTGLLNRGFQASGADCRVIMPGQATADSASDLLRCDYAAMRDAEWWRQLQLDGVVLYAWTKHEYLPIATAIRKAGIRLLQSIDTGILPSPYADFSEWWQARWGIFSLPISPLKRIRPMVRAIIDLVPAIHEKKRLEMFSEADGIAATSPAAMNSISRYLRGLKRADLVEKLIVVPHPVLAGMDYHGERKEKRVLVVGRWAKEDQAQKNPQCAMNVLGKFLASKPDWTAEVVGRFSGHLNEFTSSWLPNCMERLTLTEAMSHTDLMEKYAKSSILLCPSRYESFHIPSAEAVCSGCSVVVGSHVLLEPVAWFTSESSGTLAESNGTSDLTAALLSEAEEWENGSRDPYQISAIWKDRLHAPSVAESIMNWMKN